MRALFLPIALSLAACGGSTTSDTGSTSPGGGAAGTNSGAAGASASAGATSGGTGGAQAAGTGGAQGGSAGAQSAGAGGAKAGSAGTGGAKAGAGGAKAGAGGAKAGSAGAGGAKAGAGGASPGCCKVDLDCGDFAHVPCVEGVCKLLVPDACWSDAECAPGEICAGAFVCACGADCDAPDKPGACAKKQIPQNFTECNAPGDCVLADATCCGACGVPTASDKVAVLASKTGALDALLCGPSGVDMCPDCIYAQNPDLAAFCIPDTGEVSLCGVVEISKHAVSACASDADCVLRRPVCCDCGTGAPEDYVALSKAGLGVYDENLCGQAGACADPCVATPPAGYAARCDAATSHCKVVKE
ncbi:MAG: hypothetical protein IT374_26715 [Polyangiaceae bacterium]|nr:hypothetical protein [Polyangiaceae bacterium]